MYRKISVFLYLLFCWTTVVSGQEKLCLASVFDDDMVLQQSSEVPIWGKASPNSKVTVTVSWTDGKFTVKTSDDGRWKCTIPTPVASYDTYSISVRSGRESLILKNVAIGEVWLCSGQSNMEMTVGPDYRQNMVIENVDAEIAAADFPQIHFINVERNEAYEPLQDIVTAGWKLCSPESVVDLSAVAYYFAVKVQKELDVPVGLIMVPYGGSPVQAWLPDIVTNDSFYDAEKLRVNNSIASGAQKPNFNMLSSLFNGMLNPVTGYGIKGFLWYQGESNVSESARYPKMMCNLISSWRDCWGNDKLPFYQVQLAPYIYPGVELGMWANLSWAQKIVADIVENCHTVPIPDLGDDNNIHPSKKKTVGERLASVVLNDTYGMTDIECYSPEVESVTANGAKEVIVRFSNVYDGLHFNGAWNEFEVSSDGILYARPECSIVGKDQITFTTNIDNIKYVRYCWRDNCRPNLFNSAGLPAGPFFVKISD